MAILIELNEIASPEVRETIEATIRDAIGAQTEGGDWRIWIYSAGLHHRIVIKGPTQTRERIFLEKGHELIEPLTDWLRLYPFR